MADNPSIFLKVRLSKPAYEAYLTSNSAVPGDFDDWIGWLADKGYDVSEMQGCIDGYSEDQFRHDQVKPAIEAWCSLREKLVKSDYNEDTQVWQFGVVDYTYESEAILRSLPLLRDICRFKDTPDPDFLMVYDFLNGVDGCLGAFSIEQGRSRVCEQLPDDFTSAARSFLSSLLKYDD